MKLVRGDFLSEEQRRDVLRTFIYRSTRDHRPPLKNPPAIMWPSDEDWLRNHAFHITTRGKLASRPDHCYPVSILETEDLDKGSYVVI